MTVLPRSIFATMRSPCLRRAACAVAIVAMACSKSPGHQQSDPPPPAEFLLSSADSTFWVATTKGETRVRGAPLVLANYDGRFYELYTADDDYSFPDASMVGERLYRRDLITGDSALVFADTVVPRFAKEYALVASRRTTAQPRRGRGSQPRDERHGRGRRARGVRAVRLVSSITSTWNGPDRPLWHSTRRGVIDLRSGRAQTVADVFGGPAGRAARRGVAARLPAHARFAPHRSRRHDRRTRRAADALGRLEFDDRSFNLDRARWRAGVAVQRSWPRRGRRRQRGRARADRRGFRVVVAVRRARSSVEDDGGNDRWRRSGYRVLARYDTSGDIAHVSIADSAKREWPVMSVLAPLHRIDWLDRPAIGDDERRALTRAFNQAAAYDHATRVASADVSALRPATSSRLHAYLVTSHASFQDGSRKPARNIRAHDARARQQHGPRVRRRDSLDNGQVRGDRRVSSQPRRAS